MDTVSPQGCLSGREAEERSRGRGVVTEAGSKSCSVADFEDGGRRPQSKECWWSPEARKAKKRFLPTTSRKDPRPSSTWILAQ